MKATQIEVLAELRTVVGYLGEREQYGWWQCSFFGPGSQAFLTPVFSKTQVLAQCAGVTRAAALVHDERIGVGQVYHLFRLPEDIEQGIHQTLHDVELGKRLLAFCANRESALAYLHREANEPAQPGLGPTRVGGTQDLRDPAHWRVAAGYYRYGFSQPAQVFPYFADRA
jgi:hypothetical protein